MLFKQGDVAAKLEKKSELYKTFPHFYKNDNLPFTKRNSSLYKMKIPTNHPHPYRNGKVGGVHQMKVTTFFRVNLLKTIRQYRVVSSVNIYYLEMFVEG